ERAAAGVANRGQRNGRPRPVCRRAHAPVAGTLPASPRQPVAHLGDKLTDPSQPEHHIHDDRRLSYADSGVCSRGPLSHLPPPRLSTARETCVSVGHLERLDKLPAAIHNASRRLLRQDRDRRKGRSRCRRQSPLNENAARQTPPRGREYFAGSIPTASMKSPLGRTYARGACTRPSIENPPSCCLELVRAPFTMNTGVNPVPRAAARPQPRASLTVSNVHL